MKRNYQTRNYFLVPIFFLSIGLNRLDVVQEYWRGALNLTSGVKIGQTFKAQHDNLNMIKLFTDNIKLKNKDKIIFHLREVGKDTDLATITLTGGNIGENFILRLQFEPILGSAGKNFYFYLDDVEGQSLAPIEIHSNPGDVYPDGEAMVNDRPVLGDLFFRTYYRVSFKEGILSSISDFKTRFLKEKDFAAIYLLITFGLAGFSLVLFAKRKGLV